MDFYSPLGVVAAIVGGIVLLRVFFTFWEPFDKKVNARSLEMTREPIATELSGVPLNVRLRSGVVLEGVVLEGRSKVEGDIYELNRMLILRGADGSEILVRPDRIECFEKQAVAASAASAASTAGGRLADADEPENWA